MAESTGLAVQGPPRGRVLPLNSRRLTKNHLQSLAEALGVPATGFMEQLEVVVAGKLQEMEKEPVNVQVVVFDS